MGSVYAKIMNTEESQVDNAVKNLDILRKSSKDKAMEIMDAMRKMESLVETLRLKKKFIKSKTLECEKKVINLKVEDEEKSLSIHNEKSQSRNNLFGNEIIISETHSVASNKSSLPTGVLSNSQLYNQQEADKYLPPGSDHQTEFQSILRENDALKDRIKKLEDQLVEEKDQYKQQLRALKESIEEKKKTDLIMTIKKLQNDKEIDNKNATEERNLLQKKINELQEKEKCSTDQFALLQKENERLKTDIDRLMAKAIEKKYISFHSVLKQPQSDQAVNGILDLLRSQYSDTDLETVEKSKRKKNTPLLVVLYNLSRIADDVKGALSGIEVASDVALVVLQPKEIKKPSEKILTDSDFRKLGIIVDMNFISAKGIISNDVTDKAIHQLVGFINKF